MEFHDDEGDDESVQQGVTSAEGLSKMFLSEEVPLTVRCDCWQEAERVRGEDKNIWAGRGMCVSCEGEACAS